LECVDVVGVRQQLGYLLGLLDDVIGVDRQEPVGEAQLAGSRDELGSILAKASPFAM